MPSAGIEPPPEAGTAAQGARDHLQHAARGGMLLGIGQALGMASSFLATLVLARLLTPEDFGIVGMATVILGFVATFSDLGLTAALIQRKELDDAHKDAAFWASFLTGLGLFALSGIAAPLLSSFYREPRVTGIVIGSAVSLVLGPLWSTHASLLRRGLRFGTIAKIELARGVANALTAIVGASLGLGYWAIVLGPLAGHLVAIPACRISERSWRPGFRGTLGHARQLFSFSLYVAGATSVSYVGANVDYLIVGRVLGPLPLGIYMLGYQLVTLPRARISTLFSQVMFPTFSAIQGDLSAMREAFLGISRSLALISLPVLGWMAVVAPELILVLYGEKWLPAAPIVRLLCVAGALRGIGTLVGIVFMSRGKPHVDFFWNIAWAIGVSIAILFGIRSGAEGVAAATSILYIPGFLFTEWLACRYLELPLRRLLAVLALPFSASLVAVALGFLLREPLAATLPAGALGVGLRLAVLTLATLSAYAAILRLMHPGIVSEVRSFLAHFRKNR